jgi:hypothetical protein
VLHFWVGCQAGGLTALDWVTDGHGTHHPSSLLRGKLALQAVGASTVLCANFQVIWSTCNFAASKASVVLGGFQQLLGLLLGKNVGAPNCIRFLEQLGWASMAQVPGFYAFLGWVSVS